MTELSRRLTSASTTMAHALRHEPDHYGLVLDAEGWTEVADLLSGLASRERAITEDELDHIIASDSKGRYVREGSRVRAQQGHNSTTGVRTGEITTPPEVLYHGTPEGNVASILSEGLQRRGRDVHLSATSETAVQVGARRGHLGRPRVLLVAAAAAAADGVEFRLADNGVWLADEVPAAHISLSEA